MRLDLFKNLGDLTPNLINTNVKSVIVMDMCYFGQFGFPTLPAEPLFQCGDKIQGIGRKIFTKAKIVFKLN